MAKKVIQAQMQQRRDTAAQWAASNPVLLEGELGIVTDDPNLYKIGDGVTAWNDLKFRGFDGTLVQTLGDSENAAMSQKAVTSKLTELESYIGIEYPLELRYNSHSEIIPNVKKGAVVRCTIAEITMVGSGAFALSLSDNGETKAVQYSASVGKFVEYVATADSNYVRINLAVDTSAISSVNVLLDVSIAYPNSLKNVAKNVEGLQEAVSEIKEEYGARITTLENNDTTQLVKIDAISADLANSKGEEYEVTFTSNSSYLIPNIIDGSIIRCEIVSASITGADSIALYISDNGVNKKVLYSSEVGGYIEYQASANSQYVRVGLAYGGGITAMNMVVKVSYSYSVSIEKNNQELAVIKDELTKIKPINSLVLRRNLFDKNKATKGYYINYTNGKLTANASCFSSDFIPIEPSYCIVISGDMWGQIAVYNSNKTYIKGYVSATAFNSASQNGEIPNDASFMRLSGALDKYDVTMAEYGCEKGSYLSYGEVDYSSNLDSHIKTLAGVQKNVVTIGEGGDYDTFRSCFAAIKPTENSPITVNVLAGTYDIRSEFTDEERNASGFIGLRVPDYVKLIGVAGKENTTLIWDGTNDAASTSISTLNLANNVEMQGLRVEGHNIRYVIHDDYATAGVKNYRKIVDCYFFSNKTNYGCIYGSGHRGMLDWHFENVVFHGSNMKGFYSHNNTNVSQYGRIVLDACYFNAAPNDAVVLSSLNTNTPAITEVIIKGCRFPNGGKIKLIEEAASTYGAGIKYKAYAYGCNIGSDAYIIQNTDGNDYSDYITIVA